MKMPSSLRSTERCRTAERRRAVPMRDAAQCSRAARTGGDRGVRRPRTRHRRRASVRGRPRLRHRARASLRPRVVLPLRRGAAHLTRSVREHVHGRGPGDGRAADRRHLEGHVELMSPSRPAGMWARGRGAAAHLRLPRMDLRPRRAARRRARRGRGLPTMGAGPTARADPDHSHHGGGRAPVRHVGCGLGAVARG